MKRMKKTILFLLVLILFLLLTYTPIDSAKFNVRQIQREKEIEKIETSVDLDKLRKNLDLILSLDIKESEMSWGKNPFELPLKLRGKRSKRVQKTVEGSSSTPLKLQGVVINGEKAWAVIDRTLVKVGDHISGRVVEKIEMGKVVLRLNQTLEVLYLD